VWEIEESGLTFCATLYIIYLPSLVGHPVYDSVPINGAAHCLYQQYPDLAFCWLLQPKPVLPLDKVELGFDTPGNLLLATLIIWKTFFDTSFHCSGLCWTVVAPNKDTAVPAEGMATYRHWSVSLWRDPDDVQFTVIFQLKSYQECKLFYNCLSLQYQIWCNSNFYWILHFCLKYVTNIVNELRVTKNLLHTLLQNGVSMDVSAAFADALEQLVYVLHVNCN